MCFKRQCAAVKKRTRPLAAVISSVRQRDVVTKMAGKPADFVKRLFEGRRGEVLRYLIIGGCTTLFNLIIFTVMVKAFFIDVTVSNVTSVILSILFAYVTNKLFVFRSHCASLAELAAEFAKFVGARLVTMVIEVGGVYLLVNIIGQDELLGKLETQVLVIIGNYFISKFLVFKNKKTNGKKQPENGPDAI